MIKCMAKKAVVLWGKKPYGRSKVLAIYAMKEIN